MTDTERPEIGALRSAIARGGALLSHPVVTAALPIIVIILGIVVLRGLARDVTMAEVRADLVAAPVLSLIAATAWMLVSFAGIAGYDVLAVRGTVPGRVPMPVAALVGAGGNAISNLLGFSYVTGTAFRYRIYAGLGLDLGAVAAILATAWLAFWTGIALILGIVLVVQPLGLAALLPLGRGIELGIGAALLAALAGGGLWIATGRRRVRFGRLALALPSIGGAGMLVAAALVDVMGAAMTLWVLMPDDLPGLTLPWFIVVFIAAMALGIVSHAPAGLGVFEAVLLTGLGATGRSDVLVALLLYRLIYTVLPFVLTILILPLARFGVRGRRLTEALRLSYRIAGIVVPPAAAGIALLSGLVLLLSSSLPVNDLRLAELRELLPLEVAEVSHLAASVAGILLIVVARGLNRRLFRAWIAAMALLAVGVAATLSKGLDWEEALLLLATMALLGAFRPAFYRVEDGPLFRLNAKSLAATLALAGAAIWLGFLVYDRVEYRAELWWNVAWSGDASRFLRAALAVLLVLAAVAVNSLISSRGRRVRPEPIPDAVRRLVAQSPAAESGLALLGDKAFLVDPQGRAFLAYADTGRSLIANGDPVGDPKAGAALIWRLREMADRTGRRCAFYSVSTDYLPTYLDLGLSILKIGEVASIALAGFTLDGSARKDFRHARSRAARDGLVFEMLPPERVPEILPELRQVSDAWLASKQGEEKGFSLGAFEESYIANFDVAVLRRGAGGEIVAFANLMRGDGRSRLSVDLMRYLPGGPGCAMDALFGEILLWASAQGFARFSLGAAPFSGMGGQRLAPLWSRIGGLVYQHGDRFYNFEGLRAFKQKFEPDWTPTYLACPRGLSAPGILYEVNVLISGGIRGLLK